VPTVLRAVVAPGGEATGVSDGALLDDSSSQGSTSGPQRDVGET
jgi:hypothetical protein